MRIYIIGNDGITLCREPPATGNKGEVAVASREELHAARLSGKRLLALWNALPGVEKETKVGDSDALIVKGLVAIAFMIFSGKSARDILAIDAGPLLRELGLHDHLTPQRSNGFASMIERIKSDARSALQLSPAEGIAGR